MRKFLVFIICLVSCFLVGCNEEKEPPVDLVISVEVCSELKNKIIYKNDNVNLDGYTALVTYESGITETLSLISFGINVLDTSTIGEKTINLTYKEKDFSITYTVLEIVPIDAMYKGETITFFRNETFDFRTITISVLFNNGNEENISLTNFTLGTIDYSLTEEEKSFTATYQGVVVEIPYVVTNRVIEENVDYDFNDTLNIFDDRIKKIRFVNNKLIMHNNDSENRQIFLNQDANEFTFNRYWTFLIVNNDIKKVYFFLSDGTIYCELIQE